MHAEWDTIFARGIDPDLDQASDTATQQNVTAKWPKWSDVLNYRDRIRESIRRLAFANLIPGLAARLLVEHELMHYETLCYMLAQDAANLPVLSPTEVTSEPSVLHQDDHSQWIHIPAGTVTLGAGPPPRITTFNSFKWDNEYGSLEVAVRPFMVSCFPVTVREFAKFVNEKGYNTDSYWSPEDWKWVCADNRRHPSSWRPCECERNTSCGLTHPRWHVLTIDGPVEADSVPDWPVSTSLAEARAFARWAGARLITEAEWVHIAHGKAEKGSAPDSHSGGNYDCKLRHGESVRKGPASWCGARDLVGNGWEMTSSVFAPFPGFAPLNEYVDYSTEQFGGDHFVLKGASWATDKSVVRPSFRNFYRERYPYVFSKFRLCRDYVVQ